MKSLGLDLTALPSQRLKEGSAKPLLNSSCTPLVSIRGEPEPVVGGIGEVLPDAQIAFRSLKGGVAEEQLDLLQIPAGTTAQLDTGAGDGVFGLGVCEKNTG